MYIRKINLEDEYGYSVFLRGARQTGKTTWLVSQFPNCRFYDLLRPAEFERLLRHPDLLEHRTDGTDAFDTLFIGCEKFPQADISPMSVDVNGVV